MKVEEKEDFTKSLKRHSVMLMTHLQEVTSGVKVIVGAVHLIWDVFQVPALKTLQVTRDIMQKVASVMFLDLRKTKVSNFHPNMFSAADSEFPRGRQPWGVPVIISENMKTDEEIIP